MYANEAREKTIVNKGILETMRKEALHNWIEEVCGKAIEEAVAQCQFKVSIEVPLTHNVDEIASELQDKGYHTSTRWSESNKSILISWNRN
jgi:methyl coenzyme M reductase subunit C-like uncharacterized protein (methanogenesis marker protein 7)